MHMGALMDLDVFLKNVKCLGIHLQDFIFIFIYNTYTFGPCLFDLEMKFTTKMGPEWSPDLIGSGRTTRGLDFCWVGMWGVSRVGLEKKCVLGYNHEHPYELYYLSTSN